VAGAGKKCDAAVVAETPFQWNTANPKRERNSLHYKIVLEQIEPTDRYLILRKNGKLILTDNPSNVLTLYCFFSFQK
jgi:hypothetical protein